MKSCIHSIKSLISYGKTAFFTPPGGPHGRSVVQLLCFPCFLCETKAFIPEAVNVNVIVNVTALTAALVTFTEAWLPSPRQRRFPRNLRLLFLLIIPAPSQNTL